MRAWLARRLTIGRRSAGKSSRDGGEGESGENPGHVTPFEEPADH